MEIAADLIILIAIVFIGAGIYGLFRFRDFYARILITSKVETLGSITFIIGIIIHSGITFFSAKLILLMVTLIITNPLATHAIARSAYKAGYKGKGGK